MVYEDKYNVKIYIKMGQGYISINIYNYKVYKFGKSYIYCKLKFVGDRLFCICVYYMYFYILNN